LEESTFFCSVYVLVWLDFGWIVGPDLLGFNFISVQSDFELLQLVWSDLLGFNFISVQSDFELLQLVWYVLDLVRCDWCFSIRYVFDLYALIGILFALLCLVLFDLVWFTQDCLCLV